jgi:hypothetical protein
MLKGRCCTSPETGWTLPDMDEVNDVFDRDYDQAQYEQKIGTLVRNFCTKARKENRAEFEAWKEAVRALRQEDHYLLVLIDPPATSTGTSRGRFLKLSAVALAIFCVIFVISYLLLIYANSSPICWNSTASVPSELFKK